MIVWDIFRQQNEAGLRAFYMVSLRIAQKKKPHNISEKLIVPCCKDTIHYGIGCDAEQKVTSVPLSNDTVHRQMVDMSDDVRQQMNDLPFEGRKVEGSRKYSRRERVPKVRSRGEETITEPINSRIGEFHTIVVGKCCLTCGTWPGQWRLLSDDVRQQMNAELKGASIGRFAFQLDELTDVAACAQLLVVKISRRISCSVIP